MTAISREQDLDLLRAALRETTGDDELDEMVRGSLHANISRDADKLRIFREETAPLQAMVDLHLEGDGVSSHSTSARFFSKFIGSISEATKFTARSIARTPSYSENLLIEGATPGSVRIVLRVPDGDSPTTPVADEVIMDTPDSSALKKIVGVLSIASTEPDSADSDALLAATHDLPTEARTSLRKAASQIISAGWEIDGTISQRRQSEETIRVTPRGAARLSSALKFNPGEPVVERHVGRFDGLKRSLGTVYFEPNERSRSFAAAAGSDQVLEEVAALLADASHEVVAIFDVVADVSDDGAQARHRRILRTVERFARPSVAARATQPPFPFAAG